MRRTNALKLAPELVPEPLGGMNVYHSFGRFGRRSLWRCIRADALAASHRRCEICHEEPNEIYGDPLHCHEVWLYDDKKRTATLTQFRMQCGKCDGVVHLNRSAYHGGFENSITHMSQINGISRKEAVDIYDQAVAQWQNRSKRAWKIQVSKSLVRRYPQLATLGAKSRMAAVHSKEAFSRQ